MTPTERTLSAVGIVVILIHIYGAVQPSHKNWGVHLFAFYPAWVGVFAAVIGSTCLVPPVQQYLLNILKKITYRLSSTPPLILFFLCAMGLVVLSYQFSAQSHLLGDSMLILRLTPTNPSIEDVSANFRNQPLTYYVFTLVRGIMSESGPVKTEDVYHVIGLIGGILSLGAIFWLFTFIDTPAINKLLLGGFLMFNARSQFFFGYVENYTLLSVFAFIFVLSGWMALEGKIRPIVPALCIALMIGFHISAVVFLPSYFIVLFYTWKKHKIETGILAGLTIASAVAVWAATGYGIDDIMQRGIDAIRYDILPLFTPEQGIPYGIFSIMHAIDWINAVVHLSLFGSVVTLTVMTTQFRILPRKEPAFVFLGATSVIGILFSFIINPALGMARDWDLMAIFLIGLRLFAVYLILPLISKKEIQPVLVAIVVIMILRTGAWMGINANADRHLSRAEILTEPALSGTFPKIYYENLASAYYKRREYASAAKWYERYLEIDSTNPRVVGNLSGAYRALNNMEKVFEMLKRSVNMGSRNPGIYSNLAAEYVLRGDSASAIRLLRQAIDIDSSNAVAQANIAILYNAQHMSSPAATHAERALSLGMNAPILFTIIGNRFMELRNYKKALKYYDLYLEQVPNDTGVQQWRDRIRSSHAKEFEGSELKVQR